MREKKNLKHQKLKSRCLHLLPLLTCLFLFFSPWVGAAQEDLMAKRVQAHLVIKDYQAACQEAYSALLFYPDSKSLWKAYLKALAKAGDEKNLFSSCNQFFSKFPEERQSRELLETMAWAVIERGSNSSAPMIKIMSMIGALWSQDSKGIAILLKNLGDVNSLIRSVAVQLSSECADTSLKEAVYKIFKEENKWNVKLEAINAVGKMNIHEASVDLISLISHNRTTAEEKMAAISALVNLSDQMDRKQLHGLIQSNRAGLRLLACELMAHFEQVDDLDLLLPLLYDINAEVRANALQTIGFLRAETITGRAVNGIVEKFIFDPDPLVAISAAWVLTINSSNKGLEAFKHLVSHESQETRLLAAAALAATGKYGSFLIQEQFSSNSDKYVKMNLAMGLISQRNETKEACDCLYSTLFQEKEKWMWTEKGLFRALTPSTVKYNETIPNYPEAVNQLARLEILNILAMMHYPKAQQAIKSFLQQKNWGISGLASTLLLTEGDEDAIQLVQALLQDPDQHVKVQAALILALWGQGESATNILLEAYSSVDRELKEMILEGLAKIGAPTTIPFLVEKLQEPSQSLRIIAATALLACLYK